jgi:spore coat polysaccharide biosynthesis predicted glycosyltransferase SpsG
MTSLIKTQNVKKLLIDSYHVTPAYLRNLCALTYIIYIDDLNAFHYPCHMLINYNCYYHKFNYPQHYPRTPLLLGCDYAPLRREFQGLPRRVVHRDVRSVLVTTGGNDPRNTAGKLVAMAKETHHLHNLAFHIIAGRFNPYINELKHLANKYRDVVIHTHVPGMSQLMYECDIAVSAGGSTLYELCACGTPTVAFSLADNQVDGVTSFGGSYMIDAGDIRKNEDQCLNRMLDGVNQLVTGYHLRLELSEKSQNLVDGQGALRIAGKLCSI